ncbi:MAG: DNA translocase FtsK [Lachnospiraceae bacterium]|uniref:DNA translocase FtsK n=1 Tax=Candidatus Weimeria bifida TaxID=2599074 RepID=A0A6N7IWL5_9FIRM|nr:DNA translocase FtsK [Candidatus Weimeria bifida]RRF95677.1 MAG: DNA translocase FtsK [Lachnospiraceae bacterium]
MSDKKRKKAAKKRQDKAPDSEVRRDLYLWLSLAVCILLFLSNLGVGGPVGGAAGRFFFGLFGLINYVLPIVLLFGIFFAVSNKGNAIATVKIVAAFFFIVFLDGIVSVILFGQNQPSPARAYLSCYEEKSGGGMIGTLIAIPFEKGFGTVATILLFLIFMIICLVLVTEKGLLSRFIDKKSRDFHERQERRREEDLEEDPPERRTRSRELKRASHVVTESNIIPSADQFIKKPDDKKQGLREITRGDIESKEKNASEKRQEIPEPVEKQEVDLYSGKDVKTHIHMGIFGRDRSRTAEEKKTSELRDFDEPEVSEVTVTEVNSDSEAQEAAPVSENVDFDTEYTNQTQSEPDTTDYKPETYQEDAYEPADDVQIIKAEPDEQDEPETVCQDETEPAWHTAAAQRQDKPVAAAGPQPSVAEPQTAPPEPPVERPYQFPPASLLTEMKQNGGGDSEEYLQETAQKLEVTLKNFGVDVTVTDVTCGPAVTRYELHPKLGVKVSKIVNLADDIKLNLAARDIRIEAPIPGKSAVGIEVPNKNILTVPFREMVESKEFKEAKSKIAFAAGRDIAGQVVISDIAKMPHLLIAGATGSGKSVCINTIIMSILYRAKPDEVKFIMIDPKVVELSVYNGIPHLMIPVVTDPKKAAGALNWAVHEMDDRYKQFAAAGVRDIKGFNKKIHHGCMTNSDGVEVNVKKMPQIVIIVDELADLMMQSPKEVEASICRLAQLARACGIHLVIATQRPSVNVITGLIKANMPSRIAFAVTSGVDSRTILDMNGAEKLLGKGDMLYFPQGYVKPVRVQGAFVPDEDVSRVVSFLKSENEAAAEDTAEINDFIEQATSSDAVAISDGTEPDDSRDQYFADAGRLVIEKQKGSIGMLQRNFKIGFNRAARIMDQLEEAGVVGSEIGTKPRTVRMTLPEFEEWLKSAGN